VLRLRRCRDPLGRKLSAHWIPQHNLSLSQGMRKKTSSSWHFWYPQYDKCFGTPWNAGSRTPVPASGARLHLQSKCELARHTSRTYAGLLLLLRSEARAMKTHWYSFVCLYLQDLCKVDSWSTYDFKLSDTKYFDEQQWTKKNLFCSGLSLFSTLCLNQFCSKTGLELRLRLYLL